MRCHHRHRRFGAFGGRPRGLDRDGAAQLAGTDGARPQAGLIFDAAGNLYGTTFYGGSLSCDRPSACGTVFELSPPAAGRTAWTEMVLHSFINYTDGARPAAGLIFDAAGNLYGTTYEAGVSHYGTVFELSPPAAGRTAWTETVLHSFAGAGGAVPAAGLIFDSGGHLYGTTYVGGVSDYGTVFELSPPTAGRTAWTETVLHRFAGTDGTNPVAGLIFDAAGNLYGTTLGGGVSDYGTVFELSPPAAGRTAWTETVLHSFAGTDGANPAAGLIFDAAGNLYGTAAWGGNPACPLPPPPLASGGLEPFRGCGTMFELTPPPPAGPPGPRPCSTASTSPTALIPRPA